MAQCEWLLPCRRGDLSGSREELPFGQWPKDSMRLLPASKIGTLVWCFPVGAMGAIPISACFPASLCLCPALSKLIFIIIF